MLIVQIRTIKNKLKFNKTTGIGDEIYPKMKYLITQYQTSVTLHVHQPEGDIDVSDLDHFIVTSVDFHINILPK